MDLYVKCIKESQVEWTKPEKAQESTLKNVWQKAKLRLLMLSPGALIELTHHKHSTRVFYAHFTSDIREVRSTSSLETPDDELNFVIRIAADNELIIKTSNSAEKSSWILILKRVCSTYNECHSATQVTSNEDGTLNYDVFLEELRLISLYNSKSQDECGSANADGAILFHDQEAFLNQYPWYHGKQIGDCTETFLS